MLGPSVTLLIAILAAVSTAQEEDASPKYHVCLTDDNPEPYCCTNLVAGVGFGCRPLVGPEEYEYFREFQNDCYNMYAERQPACCSMKTSLPNVYGCTTPAATEGANATAQDTSAGPCEGESWNVTAIWRG